MTLHISSVEILCTTILPSKFWFHHTIGSRDTTIWMCHKQNWYLH